jgi:MoaA/NifB/PqqE/SkfB family radical SAM enzyme
VTALPQPAHRTAGLTVLWRGPLSSCNYACSYCPFAKRSDTRETLAADRRALARFCDWVLSRGYKVSVLFTPWGEALIRRHYRDAIEQLSHAPNVETVAIQTNLSCAMDWVARCDLSVAAFWITYHPSETPRAKFLSKVHGLHAMGARYSVGVVGLKEHLEEIELLRADLPEGAYLWVNAYKRVEDYYATHEIDRLVAIDPLFELNLLRYPTLGRPCAGGETTISVQGDGTARRCHFIEHPIGNIYDQGFEQSLMPRPCTANSCGCHIGYSHLPKLGLRTLFGEGFLERRATAANAETARERIAAFLADSD